VPDYPEVVVTQCVNCLRLHEVPRGTWYQCLCGTWLYWAK